MVARRLEQLEEDGILAAGILDAVAGGARDEADIIGIEVDSPRRRLRGDHFHFRPLPLIQYCHSLALGCQCISRIAPGLIVTMAAAIPVDTGKLVESTIRAVPPGAVGVGSIAAILKVYRRSVSR